MVKVVISKASQKDYDQYLGYKLTKYIKQKNTEKILKKVDQI